MDVLIDTRLREELCATALRDGLPDIGMALQIARRLGADGVRPGPGSIAAYLSVLATLGAVDATLARVAEPHLDAVAIIEQSGADISSLAPEPDSTWGVYAAAAPGFHLEAQPDGAGGWTLTGTKPWCSLAGRLTHAVITAHVPDRGNQAFAVRLDPDSVVTLPAPWVSRGLADVPSGGIAVQDLPAVPLREPGWYLNRPGFSWGAIGVAAVWYGITVALRERLLGYVTDHRCDRLALAHLGSVDRELFAAAAVLSHAALRIDTVDPGDSDQWLLATRVRAVVAAGAEKALAATGHALGPGPLTREEGYARRVADLSVYVRQHHGERDLAALGELILTDRSR